ncbi:ABC transporter permease [Mesomycoplasma molare]|uniref:ABC transporter permease n=1 Tax=Mesomycoplasma molare TaxID=171288 RepID=A0ABY5TTN7_9BACT|nr:ABC transporter permease [Mesomycoplasma molare]UWD34023.1 ABC transporter permease [Mesomycoplasma molare]
MQIFIGILMLSIISFIILSFAALSGMFSERVGIVNIGIEGMIIIGATFYGLFNHLLKIKSPWMQIPLFIISASITGLFSMLHGFVTIKLKGDHIISGVAINLLAPAISIFLLKLLGDGNRFNKYTNELSLSQNFNSDLLNLVSLKSLFIIIAFVAIIILLYKTKWGLRLKSIGENPQAADVAGINVNSYKWQGVIISGILAGIAGGIFYQWKGLVFGGSAEGFGFLALTILIMGQWKPQWILIIGFVFSAIYGSALYLQGTQEAALHSIKTYGDLLIAVPFVFTIFILIFTSKKSIAPAAVGQPYDKSKR